MKWIFISPRYFLLLIVPLCFATCECEQELVCGETTTFLDLNNLLDHTSMVIPNILMAEEEAFNFVHISSLGFSPSKVIETYEFEISMENVLSFKTSNYLFNINGSHISIPKDSIFQDANYTEGYAKYSLRLSLEGEDGFIDIVDDKLLLGTCVSLISGDIDDKDCRYSYHLIPSQFGGIKPPLCQ